MQMVLQSLPLTLHCATRMYLSCPQPCPMEGTWWTFVEFRVGTGFRETSGMGGTKEAHRKVAPWGPPGVVWPEPQLEA
jgi:hypothetical protein